jgi:hypothetical protein
VITLIVVGIAVTVVMVLGAALVANNAHRREIRFAPSGEAGAVTWMGASGASNDCDAGSTGDAGCGDGGGGGGD